MNLMGIRVKMRKPSRRDATFPHGEIFPLREPYRPPAAGARNAQAAEYSIKSAQSAFIERKDQSVARWLLWGGFVAAWTVALELPVPDTGELPGGEFIASYRYFLAKSIHVSVYAALTVLAARVALSARYRWLMIFGLMAHATATEILQQVLNPWCHRGGSLIDVGFDQLGITLGVLASWKWWTGE